MMIEIQIYFQKRLPKGRFRFSKFITASVTPAKLIEVYLPVLTYHKLTTGKPFYV